MARSHSTSSLAPPPHREGFVSGFFRRLRWSFGWIQPADLDARTDAELVSLAEDFVRRRKPQRALTVLAAFTQRTTLDPRILQRYGDVSRALGSHESAIYSYLQAAELHLQSGMASKASALLMQLVRVYPDHVDARLALGRVLEGLQRNKEAAASYAVVARILEAHGQHEACAPLLAKIAELWPMARADYQGPPVSAPPDALPPGVLGMPPAALPAGLPLATATPPRSVSQVVVGQPAAHDLDLSGPIELDLQSLISTFALDESGNEVHRAPTVAVGSYDPHLLAAAGHEPSTVCVPDDPWLGDRPAIDGLSPAQLAANDGRTASYQAIDGHTVSDDRTLMDLRAIDSVDSDTGRDYPTADATIMDLHAIRDEAPGASRVFDRTDAAREPSAPRSASLAARRPSLSKRTTF